MLIALIRTNWSNSEQLVEAIREDDRVRSVELIKTQRTGPKGLFVGPFSLRFSLFVTTNIKLDSDDRIKQTDEFEQFLKGLEAIDYYLIFET